MSNKHLLSGVKLFYPSAKEWMWNYCVYLGPFTNSNGDNFDLGVFMGDYEAFGSASAAIVYGDNPGNYLSGFLKQSTDNPVLEETRKRAELLGLIK